MTLIVIMIVVLLMIAGATLFSMCSMAAPHTEEEQELDDRDQMTYIRNFNKKKNKTS